MSLLAQRRVLGRDLPPRTMNQMLQRRWKKGPTPPTRNAQATGWAWVPLPPHAWREDASEVFSSVAAHLCSRQGLTFPRHSWHNALHLQNEWQLHTMKNVRRIMGHCSAVLSVTEATQYTSFSFPLPSISFLLSFSLSFSSFPSIFLSFHCGPDIQLIWGGGLNHKTMESFNILSLHSNCCLCPRWLYVLISTLDISSFPSVFVSLHLLWQARGIASVRRLHVFAERHLRSSFMLQIWFRGWWHFPEEFLCRNKFTNILVLELKLHGDRSKGLWASSFGPHEVLILTPMMALCRNVYVCGQGPRNLFYKGWRECSSNLLLETTSLPAKPAVSHTKKHTIIIFRCQTHTAKTGKDAQHDFDWYKTLRIWWGMDRF